MHVPFGGGYGGVCVVGAARCRANRRFADPATAGRCGRARDCRRLCRDYLSEFAIVAAVYRGWPRVYHYIGGVAARRTRVAGSSSHDSRGTPDKYCALRFALVDRWWAGRGGTWHPV